MKQIAIALSLAACAAASGASAAETTVPVSKVTIFSSGVAYFEHNGTVTGDADVLLRFKTDGINDLLKSLLVMDLGGGTVSSVNYASREPLERALKGFGVDLSGQSTLPDILRQLRGTEVSVDTPEKVTGRILAVRVQKRQVLPANVLVEEYTLDLVTPAGLKGIPMDSIRAIALADPKLNAELQKALNLLVENRDTDTRPVVVRFAGKGERQVRIGYVAEAPVWKSSYRLVLDDEKKNEALMQGWAVVENTSDSDWEKVALTLASGRPISFIQDLYTPLYVPRPVVQSERFASLRPQEYAEGIEADKAQVAEEARMLRKGRAPGGPMAGAAMPAPAPPPMVAAESAPAEAPMRPSVQAAASGAAAGELFTYRMKEPVSIPRRQSAMLPIVSQSIGARKVSIYNAGVLADHPLNGVVLTNNTGLTLLAGPMTILDGGTYAGDALLGNITPNEKRLVSYAVDLKVTVDSSDKQSQKIVGAKITRGVLTLSRKTFFTQTYLLKNKADQERTVIVEHPVHPDRTLVEPKAAPEKTPAFYRFEVTVPATITGKFDVREERTDTEMVEILPADVEMLQAYATNGEIPQKTRDALAEAVRRRNALADAERTAANIQQRITAMRRDQGDIRKNMEAVGRGTPAYDRFEKKLLDSETQIEALQKDLDAKRAEAEKLRQSLAEYLSTLNVE